VPVTEGTTGRSRAFVDCGKPLPEYEMEIRDEHGGILPDRTTGTIHVRGPSVMSGYFNAPEETSSALSPDGWLNTGDIGYMVDGSLLITGRQKDLIIINGRNIWPQDLEYLAEHQPEARVGDALAFSVPGPESREICVLVVQCRETNLQRRSALIDRLGEAARRVPILYGGSVKPDNAADILATAEVGGALVGGASLKAEDFLPIIRAA
jgi:fatty-acyl-CoA synthase